MTSSHLKVSLITLALVSVSFLFGEATLAQRGAPAPNPKTAQPVGHPPRPIETPPDYSQEALVIEQMKLRYQFERDGTGVRELNFRGRVQSEAAIQQFGQLVLPYSSANEQLDINFVRVRKPDGSVITSTASDVQDLSAPIAREAPVYTDLRQKHVTVRGLRPGDILEYHVVWRITTPLAPT